MPKLSPTGRYVLYGFWQVYLTDLWTGETRELNAEAAAGTRTTPVGWWSDTEFLTYGESTRKVYRFAIDALPVEHLQGRAWNRVECDDGHFVGSTPGCWYDGQDILLGGQAAYSGKVAGDCLLAVGPGSNWNGVLFRHGIEMRRVPPANFFTLNRTGDIGGLYAEPFIVPFDGSPEVCWSTPWRSESAPVPVRADGDLWLWSSSHVSGRSLMIGRIHGVDADPIVLWDFPATDPSVVVDGRDPRQFVIAGNSDRGQLQVRWVPQATLRERLRPVMERFTQPFIFATFFQFSTKYNSDARYPANATIVVTERDSENVLVGLDHVKTAAERLPIIVDTDQVMFTYIRDNRLAGRVLALYIGDTAGSINAEALAADAKRRWRDTLGLPPPPVLWYITRGDVRTGVPLPPSVDIYGPEFYFDEMSLVDLDNARWRLLGWWLERLPTDKPWLPIVQAYDRNRTWSAAGMRDLAALQPAFLRMLTTPDPRIGRVPPALGLAFFAVQRPGGTSGYRDLRAWHEVMFAALPEGLPPFPARDVPKDDPKDDPKEDPVSRIPAIGDDAIIELASVYDTVPPARGKDDDAYLRDAAYYGLGYMRLRATGLSHADALRQFAEAAQVDAYYQPTPDGMFPDNETIELRERWADRYRTLNVYQRQTRAENARDLIYYLIVYARARETGQAHESALRAMERRMTHDFGADDPYPVDVRRLVVRDRYFYLDTGEPWTAIETSDFSLYKRFLDGEDVRPIMAERSALGFNLLRVWLLNKSVVGQRHGSPLKPVLDEGIHPSQHANFYEALPVFAEMAGSYGLRIEFTAFTSTQSLMPKRDDQHRHWERTIDALLSSPNVLLELVNEADTHDNATDPSLLELRPNIMSSSGSNGADSPPPIPTWDYVLYHSNDLSEFQRKVGHNAMEWADVYRVPCISNENMRYPDRDSNKDHAYDAAMGAALLCAGSCFHSQQGKLSRLFSDTEFGPDRIASVTEFAQAWVAGALSVDLFFREGHYIRRDDLLGPDCIRAYERRRDGRGFVIKIRP